MTVAARTALSVETSTKRLTPASPATRADQARGERVVAHGLDRVELHEADMLVGGRVEDDRRAVLGEHLSHPLALLAVGEHGRERGGVDVAVVLELALDAEEVLLRVVEKHEPPRRDARDLPAQLGADRAARAGDHHDLAAEVARRRGRAPCGSARDRGCPRPDLADLAHDLPGARLQQLEDGRQRAHRDAALRVRRARPARAACPAPTGSRSSARRARPHRGCARAGRSRPAP